MAKRKRDVKGAQTTTSVKHPRTNGSIDMAKSPGNTSQSEAITVQVVVGSYERALHGFTATIPLSAKEGDSDGTTEVKFADTFLFNAHASAIRCLAISPPSLEAQSEKVILASGSTDERINLYQLSTSPPPINSKVSLPTLNKATISENPKNRELGSALHHSSSISGLYFPTKSKLLSASEDNTIAICRTRDWTVLSTIKAPIPKPVGRPSGDTAAPGEVPAGVNDFSVHPSMKLMVSVGKGERCMRLWNLVTGKKAGVLNFDRDILQRIGEGKHSSGEGRKAEWDNEGEEFVVAFERGAIVFGLDSKPRAIVVPAPRTKIHQIRYVKGTSKPVLAISTEDGRILFFGTNPPKRSDGQNESSKETNAASDVPTCTLLAQLAGAAAGISGRIKDFEILPVNQANEDYFIVAASSDGAVRIWKFSLGQLDGSAHSPEATDATFSTDEQTNGDASKPTATSSKQIGQLLGTYETGHRITCLASFVMTGKAQEGADTEEPKESEEASSSDSD